MMYTQTIRKSLFQLTLHTIPPLHTFCSARKSMPVDKGTEATAFIQARISQALYKL